MKDQRDRKTIERLIVTLGEWDSNEQHRHHEKRARNVMVGVFYIAESYRSPLTVAEDILRYHIPYKFYREKVGKRHYCRKQRNGERRPLGVDAV